MNYARELRQIAKVCSGIAIFEMQRWHYCVCPADMRENVNCEMVLKRLGGGGLFLYA